MAVTLDTLKKTIGKKKVKSMAFAWLADYENMAGDTTTALARVDAGLQLYPGDIPGMLVRSKILFQQGNFEECIKECERVLEKEPFCLSAQKRMGEAYEQLENIEERNHCFRRVHDMDPLDTFWKEEYEAIPEAAAAAVASAVGEAVADSEFAMPDMEGLAAEGSSDATEPAGEAAADAQPAAEETEGSMFSKSLDMDVDAAPADASAPAEAAPVEEQPKPYVSPFSAAADDDPFAALASLGSDDSLGEESTIDSLQQSLESAMGSDISDVSLDQEISEGEEISGNDLDSAFSNFFGEEDDLDSLEGDSASASPFAQMDLPTSLDDDSDVPEEKPQSVFGDDSFASEAPADATTLKDETPEDKPQSIDDAFGDIFGEDELPEELPASTPAPNAEQSAEIKTEEDSFSSGGLFEKSASVDMGLGSVEDDLKLDDSLALDDVKPEADKPQSLDDAFGDIFGEDELPEELPAAAPAASSPTEDVSSTSDTFDLSSWSPDAKVEDSLDIKSDDSLELPAEDTLDTKLEDPLDWSVDNKPEDKQEESLELPVDDSLDVKTEETLEEPAEPAVQEEPLEVAEPESEPTEPAAPVTETSETSSLESEGFGVDKAFDALFAEEDELPEEKPAEVQPTEEVTETSVEASAEDVLVADDADKVSESVETEQEKDELHKEMGEAFSSLFAEEDDLPVDEAKPEVAAASEVSQEDTGANLEEAPLEDASLESDLDKSFSSLFGEDDSIAEDAPAAEQPATTDAEAVADASVGSESDVAVDAGSLESEFSGAFKQLFDTDDDSLDEKENAPSNKGVDFLMSGDSDDEVSAGLVKDPTVPLDNLTGLDESLNTPTLAEIYFEQGLYDKALGIYQDLARKEPENESIQKRLEEIEAAYRSKFGEGSNG